MRPEIGRPFIVYGPPRDAKSLFSLNVSSKTMQNLVVLIGNNLRIREESGISPLSLPLAGPLVSRRFHSHSKPFLRDARYRLAVPVTRRVPGYTRPPPAAARYHRHGRYRAPPDGFRFGPAAEVAACWTVFCADVRDVISESWYAIVSGTVRNLSCHV